MRINQKKNEQSDVKNQKGFARGYNQLKKCDQEAFILEICTLLEISKISFFRIKKWGVGIVRANLSKKAIEDAFARYNILDIWDE